ncbi:MAG TPA: type II secretion system protein [Verrucomicrobiales bacterium]|nr:type II secretion system protein [Verrucomicrobiales bacterium]
MKSTLQLRVFSRAFNIRELMVLLAIFAILAVVFTSHKNDTWRRRQRIACVGQQKQLGLAFRIFATDHGDKYPMSFSTNFGGTAEWKTIPANCSDTFRFCPMI